MADSSRITAAIIAALKSDAGSPGGLMTLMTDGVYFGAAPPKLTKFVLVTLSTGSDEPMFGGRAFEKPVYLVKAVHLATAPTLANAAAARIDSILNFETLSASGYGSVDAARLEPVAYTEVDDADPDIRWQHAGGLYEAFAA